ncbi:MAG: hypothetical protein WCO02_04325 [Bacteroidota bacterium]
MKNSIRFWLMLASVLVVQSLLAQSEAQVTALKPDEVWPVVYKVINKIAAKVPSVANAKEVRFDDGENYVFGEGLHKSEFRLCDYTNVLIFMQ